MSSNFSICLANLRENWAPPPPKKKSLPGPARSSLAVRIQPLREFRTASASDERAGPGNEANFEARSLNLNFRYMATRRHTHASSNAVTHVWGSLRLAPIKEVYTGGEKTID